MHRRTSQWILCAVVLSALATSAAPAAQADKLGYLFTSAQQRHSLNSLREQYQRGQYQGAGKGLSPPTYTFNGVLSRRGKTQTIWLNGSPAKAPAAGPNRRGEYRLDLPQGQVHLKPGQHYPSAGRDGKK